MYGPFAGSVYSCECQANKEENTFINEHAALMYSLIAFLMCPQTGALLRLRLFRCYVY